ncbi:MAG: peptide ABC transporter substrate-binding protein [Anaerolineales bacterium]|nr:peptide ABC transporter substrate-binding protein [Anaerolineales bacterium]
MSLLVLASMILAACGGGAPATEVMTEEPAPPTEAPTTAPTEPAMPAFEGTSVSAESCDYGGEFKSIEAVDAYTVKFTLCYPDPAFLSKVAFAAFAIQDADYLNETGGDSAKMSETPNGTGPYMVKEWVRGDHITFEANPTFWGDAPANKTLIFRWSAEASARLLELQSGTADGIFLPSSDDFATIEGDPNLKLYPFQTGNIFYIGLNNTIAPFDNDKVRQAVAMAINKKQIVDSFYPAGSEVAQQFVPPSFLPGYSTSGDGASWYDYDPAAAKALLAEAGFPNGFETTLSYRDVVRVYLPNVNQVAQEIQAQLAEIGITITINKMESGPFLESVAAGEQGLYLLGWGMDYPDSTNFYDYHFASNAKRFGNEWPDLVEEIKAAAQLGDPAARQAHYDVVNALIKEHVPMIPVAHGSTANAMLASVGNVVMGPLNENFEQMTTASGQLVWVQSAEPIMLACQDETDGETLRACEQVYDSLLGYEFGGVAPIPALATEWSSNTDGSEWTFTLREGVTFHNGATFDANDVVATYSAWWDAANPNHKGNTGTFEYFTGFFAQFLNAPK